MVAAIECRRLSRSFGSTRALDGLEFQVAEGEIYGLLGANGAGKSTTINVLSGLLEPTDGVARILGHSASEGSRRIAGVLGVMFGENHVPEPGMSAVRYLRHFARLHGLAREGADVRARELLNLLRFAPSAERPIGSLSGGSQRKVELARAFLHRPRVLILDEPSREFDLPTKEAWWSHLRETVEREGISILVCSHDAHEIATLCDRIGILSSGRLVWEGPPAELGTGSQLVHRLSERIAGDVPTGLAELSRLPASERLSGHAPVPTT